MRKFSREWLWAYGKARALRLDPVSAVYRATRFAVLGDSGRIRSDAGQRSRRLVRSIDAEGTESVDSNGP